MAGTAGQCVALAVQWSVSSSDVDVLLWADIIEVSLCSLHINKPYQIGPAWCNKTHITPHFGPKWTSAYILNKPLRYSVNGPLWARYCVSAKKTFFGKGFDGWSPLVRFLFTSCHDASDKGELPQMGQSWQKVCPKSQSWKKSSIALWDSFEEKNFHFWFWQNITWGNMTNREHRWQKIWQVGFSRFNF